MLFIFILIIGLHLSISENIVRVNAKQNSPTVYEKDLKKQIEGYCVGKSQDFCSVEHLLMIHKLIEEKERKIRMKQMKDNVIKEIVNSIRGLRKIQIKERIVKELIKSIQQ